MALGLKVDVGRGSRIFWLTWRGSCKLTQMFLDFIRLWRTCHSFCDMAFSRAIGHMSPPGGWCSRAESQAFLLFCPGVPDRRREDEVSTGYPSLDCAGALFLPCWAVGTTRLVLTSGLPASNTVAQCCDLQLFMLKNIHLNYITTTNCRKRLLLSEFMALVSGCSHSLPRHVQPVDCSCSAEVKVGAGAF